MASGKYTLPRHTNLAGQGLRIVAAIVDFAITLAVGLAFLYGVFMFAFSPITSKYENQLNAYRTESHLMVKDEKGNVTNAPRSIESYQSAVEGFYLRYMAGNPLEGEAVSPNAYKALNINGEAVMPKDYYTVEYFNREVLGITQDDPEGDISESYFTYKKDGSGNYLKNEIAIRRDVRYDASVGHKVEITDEAFLSNYEYIYVNANYYLVSQSFYQNASMPYQFTLQAEIALATFVSGVLSYIVMPLVLKNGQTLGKKIFGFGLASYDGYKFHTWQLYLRYVPFFVVNLAMLAPIWTSIALSLGIFLAVILISFALMMASPKKTALHDFAARTIVVDIKTSILFENELEEEEYIRKEDGLPELVENE